MHTISTRQRMSVTLIAMLASGCLMAGQNAAASEIGNDALLFVGNSYTYQSVGHNGTSVDRFFNDAQVSPFEAIVRAASNNRNNGASSFLANTGSQNLAVGGSKLSEHSGVDSASSAFVLDDNGFEILDPSATAGRVWDVMVLQDFSTTPGQTINGSYGYKDEQYQNFYIQGVTEIANQLQAKGQTSTKIVLYETWAREPGVPLPTAWTSREAMYQQTSQAYSQAKDLLTFDTGTLAVQSGGSQPSLNGLGLTNEVVIAPVGTALEALLADAATSAAYAQLVTDGKATADVRDILFDNKVGGGQDVSSHLALAGEFLAAAVLFETIYEVPVLHLLDSGALTQSDLTGIWTQNDGVFGGQQTLDADLARYLAGISQGVTGAVPEPTSLALLLTGGLLMTRRRRSA